MSIFESRTRYFSVPVLLSLLVWAGTISAQSSPSLDELSEAQNQLVQLVRARDAARVAAMFSTNGVMILSDGTVLVGPQQIESHWTDRWSESEGVNPIQEFPLSTTTAGAIVLDGGGYGPDSMEQPIADYARVWERNEENEWRIRVFLLTR